MIDIIAGFNVLYISTRVMCSGADYGKLTSGQVFTRTYSVWVGPVEFRYTEITIFCRVPTIKVHSKVIWVGLVDVQNICIIILTFSPVPTRNIDRFHR